MSDKEKPKPKPRLVWGRSQAAFLAALKGKQVIIAFQSGKAVSGELVGVDTYDLFIKQASGLELMVSKGAVKYIHGA